MAAYNLLVQNINILRALSRSFVQEHEAAGADWLPALGGDENREGGDGGG